MGPEDSWELSLMICVRNSESHSMCMDFSPSTDLAVLRLKQHISIWSISALKELRFFASHSIGWDCALTWLAISANGRLIVSAYADGTFMRWDAENGEPVGVLVKAHLHPVSCLAVGKDGSTFVTGSGDGS